jgi:hypothetical protein
MVGCARDHVHRRSRFGVWPEMGRYRMVHICELHFDLVDRDRDLVVRYRMALFGCTSIWDLANSRRFALALLRIW